MTRTLRAPGHALDDIDVNADGDVLGTCRCGGWSERAASKTDVRDAYRHHVAEALGLRWNGDDFVPLAETLTTYTGKVSGADHKQTRFTVDASDEATAIEALRARAAEEWSVEAHLLDVHAVKETKDK